MLQVLLLHGANVNIADTDGISPLMAFIQSTSQLEWGGPLCPTEEADMQEAQQEVNQTSVAQSENTEQGQGSWAARDTSHQFPHQPKHFGGKNVDYHPPALSCLSANNIQFLVDSYMNNVMSLTHSAAALAGNVVNSNACDMHTSCVLGVRHSVPMIIT